MAKTATFEIVINGIKESISAVDSLNKQLDALEKKIDALAKKNVNVSASGGGSNAKALDEEAKMLQKIDELHQKVAASEKAEYQELLHAKEELKEYQTIAKSLAAQDNLKSGVNNLNTMQGMKAQLHDLKAAMQTVDVGGDQFRQWATEANELTQKLKDIEASYGTFSRNVGNYANGVADGLQKVVIKVGETERTFESAREASRTLNNELKNMAVNGQQGTKEYDELNDAVKQLNSTLKDVEVSSAAMDNLLDTMQGITAIASMSEGLSALFGLDNSAIEESIQKLVALQNVLQGLETIRKQMQTQEGIGLLLSKGNKAVDAFAAKLLKVDKGAAAASKSVKLLSTSLKLLGGAGIAAAIIAITVAIDKMKKSVENMRDAINKNMDGFEAGAQAYAKAKFELEGYIRKIDEFKGTKKAEKQLIEEVTKKYDIHNKNIKNAKDLKEFLIKMSPAYLESVRAEAETMAYAAAQANLYARNLVLLEKQKRLQAFLDRNGGFLGGPAVAEAAEDLREVENELKENAAAIDELGKKTEEAGKKAAEAQKKLVDLGVGGGREKNIKDNSKKIEDTVKKVEQNIAKARVDAMKQGLTKTLAQLQLERNRRIEEAKKTGYKVAEQIELINNEFDKKELDARVKHHTDLINEEKRYAKELEELHKNTWQMEMNNSQLMHERELQDRIRNVIKNIGEGGKNDKINTLTYEYDLMIKYTNTLISRYIELKDSIKQADTVLKMFNEDSNAQTINGKTKSAWEEQIKNFERELKTVEAEVKKIIPNIDEFISEKTIVSDIQKAISARLQIRRDYYKQLEEYSDKYYKKEKTRITEEIETETQALIDAENERHEALAKMFDDTGLLPNSYLKQFKELKEASKDLLKGQSESDVAWYLGGKFMPKFNEWIDNMEKAAKEGKANMDDYIQYTSSELYQSYIKVKNDYDNFMESYKKASKDQKASMSKELEEWTDKMNVAYYKYFNAVETEFTEHENRMKVIKNNGDEQLKKANQESLENQRKNIVSYYSNMATEYERAMAGIRNNMNDLQTNDWGLINYTYEKKKLQDLQTANTVVMSKIARDKEELVQKLKDNKISFEDFDAAIDRLNTMEVQVQDIGGQLVQEMKRLPEELWRGIDQWLQQIGQAATSIIQSLADITDATIQNELDALDEQTKALEEALDKQRELTQKYSDDVNAIEDELATARGDRRQNLIDQLNAQMEAQRNSLAQEKKMEKEKDALDKRRDDLEFKQKMNQWEASQLTAKINAALAISNAAVNTWPIPAIPMMALATAVGAAQVAAVMAAKPKRYASGGLLEGPSHNQGGIRAGNVELEGNEYVVNKQTAMQNLPLMNFINSRRKRIDLDDIVEFYSTGIKKNVSIANKTKFADGGMLPTFRSDVDFEGNVLRAIEKYNERNVVVSVVDIINKSDNVKSVQALAGLS